MTCDGCGHIVHDGRPCVECWGHEADMCEGREPEPDDHSAPEVAHA